MPIEFKSVRVSNLLFDPDNPRLAEDLRGDQKKIFRFLVDDIGVDDLLNSMAASGAIFADPMIGRTAEQHGFYYVIEGNRRLAALKLLNGVQIGDGSPEPSLPAINPDVRETLREIKLQTGWDAEQLEAYLGYKHVTSAREWTPEAKAKFVLLRCNGDFSEARLQNFARRLGTTLPTLRRWLVAYLTLKQAESAGKFDPQDTYAKRYFGTFYTLLGSQEVQKFLSLSPGTISATPVPLDHLGELGDFIAWVIGTKKSAPVVNSRDQQEFDAILSSPSALQYFRSKKNIEGALLYTEFNSGQIAQKLMEAAYTIEQCLPKVFDVKDDEKVKSAILNLERAMEKLLVNTREQPISKKKQKQ
jgi:hypothetical protein